jgi:hypothetical protein
MLITIVSPSTTRTISKNTPIVLGVFSGSGTDIIPLLDNSKKSPSTIVRMIGIEITFGGENAVCADIQKV